ncbi:MAG TPA: hypothetical protein ENH20_00605, partial [Candidatus Pacearchaeota archaeon]|nr:hypothetical protein [Candidatus Pacearchaeota archaeon]
MKKSIAFLTVLLIMFSLTLTLAADNETVSDKTKIENAFNCLEEKADDCSGLTTQEVALTILATPDNIFDDCVDELWGRRTSNNWGNARDTALAILALKHAGEDTEAAEDWLMEQNKTPTDLNWYLQQDSNTDTQCNLKYDAEDYTI